MGWVSVLPVDAAKAESMQPATAGEPPPSGTARRRPGPVDIGFAQDMSLHHEQALAMARLAITKGSPRLRAMAQGIIDQQLRELGLMQGWLMLWEAPLLSGRQDMAWMRQAYAPSKLRDADYDQFIESCLRGQGMPGMATADQMEALAELPTQASFDQAFLVLMIHHHQSAVVMARFAAQHAQLEVVRSLAQSMAAEQQQEMGQMAVWLRSGRDR